MLPVKTHSVRVIRPDLSSDDVSTSPATALVASGLDAVFSAPRGFSQIVGGDKEVVDANLSVDSDDVRATDIVVDEATGETYQVSWVRYRPGLNLDHTEAGVRLVIGQA